MAERVLDRDAEWVAPVLWRSELRSTLALYLRRGGLTLKTALDIAAEAEAFMAGREFHVATTAVLQLADDSGCSAYDCEFVALAANQRVPLVTTDRSLLQSFPKIAVAPEDFVSSS